MKRFLVRGPLVLATATLALSARGESNTHYRADPWTYALGVLGGRAGDIHVPQLR